MWHCNQRTKTSWFNCWTAFFFFLLLTSISLSIISIYHYTNNWYRNYAIDFCPLGRSHVRLWYMMEDVVLIIRKMRERRAISTSFMIQHSDRIYLDKKGWKSLEKWGRILSWVNNPTLIRTVQHLFVFYMPSRFQSHHVLVEKTRGRYRQEQRSFSFLFFFFLNKEMFSCYMCAPFDHYGSLGWTHVGKSLFQHVGQTTFHNREAAASASNFSI